MAVTSVDEIHNGRDADDEITKDRGVRRYTRVFRIITDSRYTEGATILSDPRIPAEGGMHPNDIRATCRRRRASNESFSKRVWIVTCGYSTERELAENPLDDLAEIEWVTESRQVPAVKDRDGKAILNKAGDPFDPPVMKDDSRWTVTVKKNVGSVPTWILGYRDAINNAAFTLDGVSLTNEQAKLSGIRIGPWQNRNDIPYRVMTMTIQLDEDTWQKATLNAGLRQKKNGELVPCANADGTPVTSPVPLDANGLQIEVPTIDNAVYCEDDVYNDKNFSVLPLT